MWICQGEYLILDPNFAEVTAEYFVSKLTEYSAVTFAIIVIVTEQLSNFIKINRND